MAPPSHYRFQQEVRRVFDQKEFCGWENLQSKAAIISVMKQPSEHQQLVFMSELKNIARIANAVQCHN